MQRIKVLNITGFGRSGSTILASLLGQMEGFLPVGELRNIFTRGLLKNLACSCTKPIPECDLWSEAVRFLIERPREEIERILEIRDGFKPNDCLQRMMARRGPPEDEGFREYADCLGRIYRGLQAATGCHVIVDSSKTTTHGYIVDTIPDVDLYILHLVRDPRAVAFSWKRKKLYSTVRQDESPYRQGDSPYMRRHGTADSTARWLVRNLFVESLWRKKAEEGRYQRLLYEDFVESPQAALAQIARFVGQEASLDFFEGPRTAAMKGTHQLSGNPSRFASGAVEISPDTQWTRDMPRRDRLVSSLMSLPLLHRYGYPLSGPRRKDRRVDDPGGQP